MSYFQTSYHYMLADKILSSENIFQKNGDSFKMLTIFYSIPQLWATFAKKVMKRPIIFFQYFETSTSSLCVHKISWSGSDVKSYAICLNMSIKSCLFHQLWTIFSTKIMKNPTICVTYFWSLFQVLHCQAVLLWLLFYSKNDSCFNIANKLLLIAKSIFFTPCFQGFNLFTFYFSKYV